MTAENTNKTLYSNQVLYHYVQKEMPKDSLVAMAPPNPKIQFYIDAFLSKNSKEKLKEELFDCNGRKKRQICNSLWNKDIAEICDRELQLLAKSSLSIVSKARIEIIGASSNESINEESRFGSMPVSADTLNELQTVKTPFDRNFQGCNSGYSSLHFAPKALNRQFSPCVFVGEWCTRLEDEIDFKNNSKVIDFRKKEETDHFTCPVCLLKIPRDGAGGSHLEFELIELKNFSKTSNCKVTRQRSMNFSSLVTWHDGDDQNDEERNSDIEENEINIYADTPPEGDERMNSSALRFKVITGSFIQNSEYLACFLNNEAVHSNCFNNTTYI